MKPTAELPPLKRRPLDRSPSWMCPSWFRSMLGSQLVIDLMTADLPVHRGSAADPRGRDTVEHLQQKTHELPLLIEWLHA